MKVLNWCMLGVAILLLVCQVIIHQFCECLIVLLDGFHTLFILVHMAFPLLKLATLRKHHSSVECPAPPAHPTSSSAAPPPPLPAKSTVKALPVPHTSTEGSLTHDQPPVHHPPTEAASKRPPPAVNCGLSFTSSRTLAVGAFISALGLTSLCLSCITEIISFSLDPHPVQYPLLPVLVGGVSVLYKVLLLWLNWNQMQAEQAAVNRKMETESHLEMDHKVSAKGEAEGWADPEGVLNDVCQIQPAVDDSLHNGALVLRNPGTSSCIPDTDCETPRPHPGVQDPKDCRNCEDVSGGAGLSHTDDCADNTEHHEANGSQNASKTSQVCKSSTHITTPASSSGVCLLSSIFVVQGLCTPLLALINSLVTLLIRPHCLHSSRACGVLVYLDPGLSMLAVITLIATATPQVYRYGLLLLQCTPPHICVSDLGRRIAGVPGVQAVHDLHVWQLSGSLTVASVHVHCHAGFPLHRCADVLSGVTKVLQSVGVSCCTVQPEFVSCSGSSAGGESDPSPVIHREDPTSPPLLLACSLACGKACAGNMCCSPLEVESRSMLTPAGETKEEPQTLIIENTFL